MCATFYTKCLLENSMLRTVQCVDIFNSLTYVKSWYILAVHYAVEKKGVVKVLFIPVADSWFVSYNSFYVLFFK